MTVEVAFDPQGCVLVRDTKDEGQGPILMFSGREWAEFVEAVKGGAFDCERAFRPGVSGRRGHGEAP